MDAGKSKATLSRELSDFLVELSIAMQKHAIYPGGHPMLVQAIDGVMRWAQDEHDIQRFIVTISPDNVASLRLADRFGFRKIGVHVDEVDGIEGIYLREAAR